MCRKSFEHKRRNTSNKAEMLTTELIKEQLIKLSPSEQFIFDSPFCGLILSEFLVCLCFLFARQSGELSSS